MWQPSENMDRNPGAVDLYFETEGTKMVSQNGHIMGMYTV